MIRVVIADEHKLFLGGLLHVFRAQKDIECVGVAHDGAEVVRLAKEIYPDIVIMDVKLPVLDGASATKQIKSACPDTRVILFSAESDDQCITDCMKAQVNGYLLKDAPYNELINAIRMVYAGECVFNLNIISRVLSILATKLNDNATFDKPYRNKCQDKEK